jgi:predicted ATPase/class 3 adenylate cyclase
MILARMRPELPTGTVTFLFTDVEGSTKLLQELGADGYAAALTEHRRTVRQTCAAQGGVEVDTQGDAFFLAFPTAPGALAAAQAISDELASGPVKVRIGLHTGTPLLAEDGYVGDDVHRAARIAAAGHGGQVLVSASTASLLEADLRDLGEHRLKDLSAPERLYQLGEGEFPALKSLYRTNLPVPATPFLGREKELDEVAELISLPDIRLLTLTGPGGSGKTRLALQAAARASEAYPDGVFWVPLAAIRDPEAVLESASQTLGTKDGLAEHIAAKRLLLLLDNFEQVLDAASGLGNLLAVCPNLKILATSREPLHLSAEQEYPVPPFVHEEGVSFFLARARAVKPDFEADGAVSEICRSLDGLPLALELAAARVKVLSPKQILERLEESLALLATGARDLPERQRTLAATIEWSYNLLSPEEQRLFRRLAVFAGGFTLEAAEVVCEADLEAIGLLVDKSLVRASDGRFFLLETIRAYAQERLAESGENDEFRRRHALHFMAVAENAEPELTGVDQAIWLERIAQDHENLRAALDYLSREDERDWVLRLSSSLVLFWFVRGFYAEGVDWLGRAIASSDVRSAALAKALWGAGFLEVLRGQHEVGRTHLTEGLAVAREVGAESSAARTLLVLGLLAFFQNELPEARTAMEESVEIARAAEDLWCLADGLGTLSSIYPLQGDLEKAQRVGEEGLRLARRMQDQQGTRMALFGLALTAVRRGNLVDAQDLALEGLTICRMIGDPWFISYFLWILAMVAYEQGQAERARTEIEEALEVGREVGGALLVVCALEVLARLELDEGDVDSARRHLDEALTVAEGGVPKSYVAAVHLTRSRLAIDVGDKATARREIDQSLALAKECGDAWAEEAALTASEALGQSAHGA